MGKITLERVHEPPGLLCHICDEWEDELAVVAELADGTMAIICRECLRHPERSDAEQIDAGVAAELDAAGKEFFKMHSEVALLRSLLR
jgi:hypothetical protein